jgi:uncharacterized protein
VIIWIDADACPGPVRDIVLRASHRLKIQTIFVANKPLYLPDSSIITAVQVGQGPDVVDAYIVDHAAPGDLVVTQDIPLAALLVPNNISVLSPRGDLFTPENMAENLSRRNLMQDLRDQGELTGGPRPFDEKIKRQFANHFDAELQRLLRASRR